MKGCILARIDVAKYRKIIIMGTMKQGDHDYGITRFYK